MRIINSKEINAISQLPGYIKIKWLHMVKEYTPHTVVKSEPKGNILSRHLSKRRKRQGINIRKLKKKQQKNEVNIIGYTMLTSLI